MNTYRIIVGVDGSEGGERALRWAAAEADRRGGTVEAVIAWTWDGIETGLGTPTSPSEAEAHARQALTRTVTAVNTVYPKVAIAAEAVRAGPATALTRAAGDADVLVLGSHGHSRLHRAVVGSVTEQCIRAAACPIVVVPVPHRERVAKPAEVQVVS
jgi:nucleotide-binding universal stress UspA family protein